LRYCIYQAAFAGGSTTISFNTANVAGETNFSTPQTITLTNGLLDIPLNTTISGPSDFVTISGNSSSRVFNISGGVSVSMWNLNIVSGTANQGGGIYNAGNLQVTNSVISSDTATGSNGGDIYNAGTLQVTSSVISGGTAPFGEGGDIYNAGTLQVTSSVISGGTAGEGGGIYNAGNLQVTNSVFSSDWAAEGGRALRRQRGGDAQRYDILFLHCVGWTRDCRT
jgi:hypothetical protein